MRAALESIAYQVSDIVQSMQKDAGIKINRLAVDGGASRNNFLLQFQADILNSEVFRPEVVETTALGAAYLAGLCAGVWKEIKGSGGKLFSPDLDEGKRAQLLDGWHKAVDKTLK